MVIAGSILLAGIIIAGAIIFINKPQGETVAGKKGLAASGKAIDPVKDMNLLADDDPVLGSPDAKLTIVEFGDFQCPFCQRFFQTTEQQVIENYIKTGKAKLIYRDFPLSSIHAEAQKSAEASECADEQGKFWAYHDLLYNRQDKLSLNNYKKWATELSLDTNKFNNCLDSGKYATEVGKDLQSGQSFGVTGTPATFVNGRLVTGAIPYEDYPQGNEMMPGFKTIIEEELENIKK